MTCGRKSASHLVGSSEWQESWHGLCVYVLTCSGLVLIHIKIVSFNDTTLYFYSTDTDEPEVRLTDSSSCLNYQKQNGMHNPSYGSQY